jgi:alpha-tubulin suppressor-like RCC1 family protein
MSSRLCRTASVLLVAMAALAQPACGSRRPFAHEAAVATGDAPGGEGEAGDAAVGGDSANAATVGEGSVAAPLHPSPIGAGAFHTCFVRSDRSVVCWGENTFGNLGDGTESARFAPVEVQGLSDVVDLAVDATGACARRADGAVLCWGRFGPQTEPYLVPHEVRGLEGVVQLVLTSERIYGLTASGTVVFRESASDLGSGEAAVVDGISGAVELTEDGTRVCARRSDGTVLCWCETPRNWTAGDPSMPPETPTPIEGIADAQAMWGGWGATWARRANGEIWIWGHDITRAVEGEDESSARPRKAEDPSGVLAQAVMIDARCALTRDGGVSCRRVESEEDGTLTAELYRIEFPRPVRALAVGGMHVCGVDEAGEVRCFGDNDYGQLGRGDARDAVSRPTPVPGVDDAAEVVAGEWDACARRASGEVVCWSMPYGESPPPAPTTIEGITGTKALYTGGQYTCALDRRNVTRCWGLATWLPCMWESEDNCQPERWGAPRVVDGLAGIAGALEVVGECVRMPNGRVRCVERYEGGPVTDLEGVDDATRLAGGAWLRCVLRRSGRVACLWPEPGMVQATKAVDIPDVTDAIAVAAGADLVCVVHREGTVSCTEPPPPHEGCESPSAACAALRPVEGIADAVDVAVGSGFACVLHASGAASCWGSGEGGVLGDGTTRDAPAPVRVEGLDDAVELDAREDHVCARRSGGQVSCWGRILPGVAVDDQPSAPVVMPTAPAPRR